MATSEAFSPLVAEGHRRAMGSHGRIVVVADRGRAGDLVRAGWGRVDDLERRWSRFLPASEVSAVNRGAGRPVPVSAETLVLFQRAVEGWRGTDGRFDPTVGAALVAHGYDADLREVVARPRHGPGPGPGAPAVGPAPGLGGAVVDPWLPAVALPPGTTFDPGGIGKGLAADLVVASLLAAGAAGALVEIGGDLRAAGTPPAGDTWTIAVADPRLSGREVVRLAVPRGGVATSSPLRRRWRSAGAEVHHLVDPATGRPAAPAVAVATVVAGDAWWAEVVATALHLTGPAGLDRRADVHALVVTTDGARHATPGLAAVLA
ncbi:MAG TPA: FAD:protein FMN transferase [Acidimicrobiales bacterium]